MEANGQEVGEVQRLFVATGAQHTYDVKVKLEGEFPFDKMLIGTEYWHETERGHKIHGFIKNKEEDTEGSCILTIECKYCEWMEE